MQKRGGCIVSMKETFKNYEDRVKNKDFENYLHGYGIDIGGGDDCLVLPDYIDGKVFLWDFADGDAEYLHKLEDETFDFVYSSHCLEHMRNIYTAFVNWIRVCKIGGYLYICVPHEKYYEKGVWPSINNLDHKYSFTLEKKSTLPKNVEVKDFLSCFNEYIEVVEVRENLKNYDFNCDKSIDQTADPDKMVCAQIDIIVRKKKNILKEELKEYNKNYFTDQLFFLYPMKIFLTLPNSMQNCIKRVVKKFRK